MKPNLFMAVLQLALLLRFAVRRSATYLDPGSGSFIFQILIAAVLGSMLSIRIWWGRVSGFFRRSGTGKDDPPGDAPGERGSGPDGGNGQGREDRSD